MEVIRDWSTRQRGIVASESLYDDAKQKATLYENNAVINVGYTNYGGTFADKALIAFFKENYPQCIISENTAWDGENAFIFGDLADEIAQNKDYFAILEFEDYYLAQVEKVQEEEANNVIEEYFKDKELSDEERIRIWQAILTFFEESSTVQTFGVDYCENDLKEYLLLEMNINLED